MPTVNFTAAMPEALYQHHLIQRTAGCSKALKELTDLQPATPEKTRHLFMIAANALFAVEEALGPPYSEDRNRVYALRQALDLIDDEVAFRHPVPPASPRPRPDSDTSWERIMKDEG